MRIFLTGATGFAGSHLVDCLLEAGHHIYGLVHSASSQQPFPMHPRFIPMPGDLLQPAELKYLVAQAQPEVIYHLAGQAYPMRSWQNPTLTLAINTGGVANMLEAAIAYGRPRVVVVTSADMYGVIHPNQLPITERTLPQPRHPYGVSKLAAAQLVHLYWQRYQLPVVEARPFNHIGPRQALGFVAPDFASQLAAIKLGLKESVLCVGNLTAERDFTDVRDVARAYTLLAERGRPGESYLICSGAPVAVHVILNILLELTGRDVSIEYDSDRMRPSDTPVLYGSYAKIARHTGWRPTIHLRDTLADVFAEWVAQLQE